MSKVKKQPVEAAGEGESESHAPPVSPRPRKTTNVADRASCLTFVFLLAAAISTWIYLYFFNPWSISFFTALGWPQLILIFLLILVIPFVVFRTITLWMMRDTSRYPDIDFAWRQGISAIEESGISLRSAPLFLVLGSSSQRKRMEFMAASGYEFRVAGEPAGPSPIVWYANSDSIYVVLNDVCWTHAASIIRRDQSFGDADRPSAGKASSASPNLRGTIVPSATPTSQDDEQPTEESAISEEPSQAAPRAELDPAMLRGTIVPPTVREDSTQASRPRPIIKAKRITSQKSTHFLRRLQYLGHLIRQTRHPVCPVNGILCLLPYEILQASKRFIEELDRAISADLSVARRSLQLRCPVTAVVTGMDNERGFRELIRRVGHQRATRQRFGQRFDLRADATSAELEKFSAHVCGTFEDWVYTLFGEKDALQRTGNTLLYAMLCRVRRSVGTRLASLLEGGFGTSAQDDDQTPISFSGCYFAATGKTTDRQAFVRGLLDKLKDEQEEIDWTADALREDRRLRQLARAGWIISLILGVAIVGLFVYTTFSGN